MIDNGHIYNAYIDMQVDEMALTDFKKFGKWDDPKNNHGYDKQSVGILNSDSGVKKIEGKFNNINIVDLNLYFVKNPNVWKTSEVGQVTPEQLKNITGLEIGKDIPLDEDGITVVFTNNTAAEKVPLTPWTIAHRIGHAFAATGRRDNEYQRNIREIDKAVEEAIEMSYQYKIPSANNDYYGNTSVLTRNLPVVRNFLEGIGKFRSARTKQLPRTTEFIHECFAQYLFGNGEISFNEYPEIIKTSNKKAWGSDIGQSIRLKDETAANETSMNLQYALQNHFDYLINTNFGTISIM